MLEFISYVKTRGNKPSGYASEEAWHQKLRASFVDLKNARLRQAGKKEKLTIPGLIELYYFLM